MSGLNKGFGFQTGGPGGGDTNTNIANADLTLDGAHTTDVAANTLTIDSGATNIITLDGSDDTLNIGGASPYKMPTARSTVKGKVIRATDTTGGMGFTTANYTIPFQMYMQGVTTLNYHYPEPMSNNKFGALCRDSEVSTSGDWNVVTSTTIRSCLVVASGFNLNQMQFWVSVLDNAAENTPTITVEIWKFSLEEGSTDQLVPTVVATATSSETGDSNNKFYYARVTNNDTVIGGGTLLMPVFKIASALEEINLDIWIQGSITGYGV